MLRTGIPVTVLSTLLHNQLLKVFWICWIPFVHLMFNFSPYLIWLQPLQLQQICSCLCCSLLFVRKINGCDLVLLAELNSIRGWNVQDWDICRVSVWWEPTSCALDGYLFAVSLLCLMAKGTKELSMVSFIKARIPFIGFLLTWHKHLSKTPSLSTITLWIRFQRWNFEGTQTFCLWQLHSRFS